MNAFTTCVAIWIMVPDGISNFYEERDRSPGEGAVLVREQWDPACMLAIRELEGIDDPDEFERAALDWLASQEGYVAAEIAADHGRELLAWWHEEVDNTPYGVTVVALGSRTGNQVSRGDRKGGGR